MKKLLVIVSLIMLCFLQGVNTQAKSLSGTQEKRAKRIVKICTQKYKKYGVLPSVCLGQAMVESGIGRRCRANNLWGLRCGRARYRSLESGTIAYLKCINNGYYKKAPFQKNYKKQIRAIVRGGYCEPAGNYYYNVTKVIRTYHLTKYDKKMFQELQAKKKAAAAKKASAKAEKKAAAAKASANAEAKSTTANASTNTENKNTGTKKTTVAQGTTVEAKPENEKPLENENPPVPDNLIPEGTERPKTTGQAGKNAPAAGVAAAGASEK